MSGQISKKSQDCTHCHRYEDSWFVGYEYCFDHPEGRDYEGPDCYEPSEWVKSVVGKRYRGGFPGGVYDCTGYDRRCGFWMQNISDPFDRRNVSERAIDRTYHQVWEKVSP